MIVKFINEYKEEEIINELLKILENERKLFNIATLCMIKKNIRN
jgi:hypothetical protein